MTAPPRETEFRRRHRKSVYWYNKASDLFGAAAALWASTDQAIEPLIREKTGLDASCSMGAATPLVYRMVCGLSLELLYKATLVARGGSVPPIHDLVALASQAGVLTTSEQRTRLRLLELAVVWNGRYPIPRSERAFEAHEVLSRSTLWTTDPGRFRISRPSRALDWENYLELWGGACEQYRRATHPGEA